MKEINVNSPFLFVIYDTENDLPLFVGKVTNPSSQNVAQIKNNTEQSTDQTIQFGLRGSEPKKVCSGGSLKICVAEVCNFPDTELQKICFEDCSNKCKA